MPKSVFWGSKILAGLKSAFHDGCCMPNSVPGLEIIVIHKNVSSRSCATCLVACPWRSRLYQVVGIHPRLVLNARDLPLVTFKVASSGCLAIGELE